MSILINLWRKEVLEVLITDGQGFAYDGYQITNHYCFMKG